MDPDIVRLILIILGVLLVVGIYLWDVYQRRRPRPARRRRAPVVREQAGASARAAAPPEDPAVSDWEPLEVAEPVYEAEPAAESASTPRPAPGPAPEPAPEPAPARSRGSAGREPGARSAKGRDRSVPGDDDVQLDLSFDAEGRADYLSQDADLASDVEPMIIVVNIISRTLPITGPRLHQACVAAGLEHGEMSIYHCHDQGGRGVLFSMASMVEPGVIPVDDLDRFETPGVSMFTQLPGVRDGVEIYDRMLMAGRRLAQDLGAELQDDRHNKLTRQMQDHVRESIIEHRRRLQLARSRR
jgi:cell division protein ZipA